MKATMEHTAWFSGRPLLKRILLISGFLSSLLYVGVDIIASLQWEEYDYMHQGFSELVAIEAPTRPLMLYAIGIPYNLLVIAFALDIWLSAGKKRSLSVIAGSLAAYAIVGIAGSLFFPMHSRGQAAVTFTDIMHIVATALEVIFMLMAIIAGAVAFGGGFRLYSILTILLLLLGGTWASLAGSRLAEGLPTPWLGVTERINIYAFMIWVIVLSIVLLRDRKKPSNQYLLFI